MSMLRVGTVSTLAFALGALPLLTGCDKLFRGKGALTTKLASLLSGTTEPTAETFQAGVIAIGEEMVGELTDALVGAGLTDAQAQVVADSARADVAVQVAETANVHRP